MPRKPDPSRDLRAQQAAYLRGQHNLPQEEIGRILGGISQPHVSRLLARAEQMGCLVTDVRFVDDDIPEDALQQIKQLIEPHRLVTLLDQMGQRDGLLVPCVCVFDSGSEADSADALAARRKRFGKVAAGRLEELLKDAESIGVAWGSTVAGVIEGLSTLNTAPRYDRKVLFVPVCAELVGLAAPEYSSSRLSTRLNQIVNREAGDQLSLAGVPAYIPRSYNKKTAATIREFVGGSASYKEIFSKSDALVDGLDGLVTSIGSVEHAVSGNIAELLAAGGIDTKTLNDLVVGDIGGALIAKHSLSSADRRLVTELNMMWTGISLDHIRGITMRAAKDNQKPGTIVVAVGKERALVAFELIRRGLVNELIIDRDLARALEELVSEQLAAERQ